MEWNGGVEIKKKTEINSPGARRVALSRMRSDSVTRSLNFSLSIHVHVPYFTICSKDLKERIKSERRNNKGGGGTCEPLT